MENSRPMPLSLAVLYGGARPWCLGPGSVSCAQDMWRPRRDPASHLPSRSDHVLCKADTNPAVFYTRALLPAPYVVDLILVTETGLASPLVPLFCWSPLLSFGLWWLTSFWFIQHWLGLMSSLPISHAPFESELVSDISHVRIGTYDSASFEFKALLLLFQRGVCRSYAESSRAGKFKIVGKWGKCQQILCKSSAM